MLPSGSWMDGWTVHQIVPVRTRTKLTPLNSYGQPGGRECFQTKQSGSVLGLDRVPPRLSMPACVNGSHCEKG